MSSLKNRPIDKIVSTINRLEAQLLIRRADGSVELAPPNIISETIGKMAVLLQQTVDPITDIELEYRTEKARRYHGFIKPSDPKIKPLSKSAAVDALDFEQDLIDMKMDVLRFNNYIKMTQQTISTMQSNIRVKTGMANGQI